MLDCAQAAPGRAVVSISQMGTLRTRLKAPGSLVACLDCMWAVSTVRGKRGTTALQASPWEEWQGTVVRHNCLYWFTDLDVQTGCCRGDLRVSSVLSTAQGAASSHPTSNQCAGARVGVPTQTPAVRSQRSKGPRLPRLGTDPGPGHMGLLGRGAGQRVSWDWTWWGGWGMPLKQKGWCPQQASTLGFICVATG